MIQFSTSMKGKNVIKIISGLGGATGFLTYVLPNTLLTDKYKDITQLYKKSAPVCVSSKSRSLVTEVMNDIGLSQEQRDKIIPYTSYGFDIFYAGMTSLGSSGVLGLPKNFSCSNPYEFLTEGIRLNGEEIDWSSPNGIKLKNSLILSDDAKKFVIAQNLFYINSLQPLLKGCFTGGLVLLSGNSTVKFMKKLHLDKTPLLKFSIYGIATLITYCFWALGHDFLTCIYEKKADRSVTQLGSSYVEGGVEFYSKILDRNIALRGLMGSEGEDRYTAYGNVQVLFRSRNVPITVRRDDLKLKAG